MKIPSAFTAARDQLAFHPHGQLRGAARRLLLKRRNTCATWDDYNAKVKKGDKDAKPPKSDLKLEALADVLRGKLLVQIHCYRADEFLTEMAMAKEYGYKIRAFHHALEAYKVADKIAADGVGIATFADWWGFKDEAWDAHSLERRHVACAKACASRSRAIPKTTPAA